MEIEMLSQLMATFGVGGIFLWAWWDQKKAHEIQASEIRKESAAREQRMVLALEATQAYIQNTFQRIVVANTEMNRERAQAMEALVEAIKDLPCHHVRRGDIDHLVGKRAEET